MICIRRYLTGPENCWTKKWSCSDLNRVEPPMRPGSKKGRVAVSTAIQDNFGISVVEAVRFGCFPILPRRLSYPELMPASWHEGIFYRTEHQLVEKLTYHLQPGNACMAERNAMATHMQQFSWEIQAPLYDDLLETLVRP